MIKLNPIAIAATSQQYAVTIEENLCKGFCITNATQPNAIVTYSVGPITTNDGTAFVTINADAVITYQPVCGGACNTKVETYSESFVVGFVGTGTPTIALTNGGSAQSARGVRCNNHACGWAISTDLTIAATFPA